MPTDGQSFAKTKRSIKFGFTAKVVFIYIRLYGQPSYYTNVGYSIKKEEKYLFKVPS